MAAKKKQDTPKPVQAPAPAKRRATSVFLDGEIEEEDLVLVLVDKDHYEKTKQDRVVRRIRLPGIFAGDDDTTEIVLEG